MANVLKVGFIVRGIRKMFPSLAFLRYGKDKRAPCLLYGHNSLTVNFAREIMTNLTVDFI